MGSLTEDGTKKIEKQKKKRLRCRELQVVEAGFMVGGKNRNVRLLPSLSNYSRWVRVQNFQDSDSKGFVKDAAVIQGVFK